MNFCKLRFNALCWRGLVVSTLIFLVDGASNHWSQDATQSQILNQGHPHSYAETAAEVPKEQGSKQEVPIIRPSHIALSLRLTCELNRRLQEGTASHEYNDVLNSPQEHQIPHPASPRADAATTIFHARTVASSSIASASANDNSCQLRGTERWGTELPEFIRQLVEDTLELSEDELPVVLSLAMIYLDRSNSIETGRGGGVPPCPSCTCRTVHRLLLTAILTATRIVRGRPVVLDQYQLESYGLCVRVLTEMLAWFELSLGDLGHFVSLEDMQSFKVMWERVFWEEQPEFPLSQQQIEQQEEELVASSSDENIVDSDQRELGGLDTSSSNEVQHGTDSDVHDSESPSVPASQGFRPLPAFASTKVHAVA